MAIIYNPNKKSLPCIQRIQPIRCRSTHWDICCICTMGKNKQFHGLCLNLCRPRISGNPYAAGMDRTYSLDALPQEYPSLGTGDYRNIALNIKNEKGVESADLLLRAMRSEAASISYRDFRLSGQMKTKHRLWK